MIFPYLPLPTKGPIPSLGGAIVRYRPIVSIRVFGSLGSRSSKAAGIAPPTTRSFHCPSLAESGLILRRRPEEKPNPLEKPKEIAIKDIDEKRESKVSLMPEGLLTTLTKDEILDLLAYITTGADPNHAAFKK